MPSAGLTLSLSALINAPAFIPPGRRKSKTGRPISGPFGEGNQPGKRRGAGMDLDSIGAFQDGDDPRHIDWSATARTGRPQVRRFLSTVQRPLAILVDLRTSMFFGTSGALLASRACQQAAAVSTYLRRRREPFTIRSIGAGAADDRPPFKASTSARTRALDLERLFADYQAELQAPESLSVSLGTTLRQYCEAIPFHYDLMIISDFSNADDQLGAAVSSRREQSVHALIVTDPVFARGFAPGIYPTRTEPQAPVETYLLPRQANQAQHQEIARWRTELIARLERHGFGTIWDLAR